MHNAVYYIVIIVSYLFLIATSGYLISYILKKITNKELEVLAAEGSTESEKKKNTVFNVGNIIGKCENVLVLSFMLLDAYTAMALVVTAKTIVRKEEIEKNSIYFLAGTLINISYSVLIGFITKLILKELEAS
jgi:hypothetical protein